MTYHNSGMGFAPIVTGEPISSLVGTGASVLASLFGIFGGGGDGVDDYQAYIRPVLVAKAQDTGKAAFCTWYGEIAGVSPQGTNISLGSTSGSGQTDDIVQQYADDNGGAAVLVTDPRESTPNFVMYYGDSISGYAEQVGAATGLSMPVLIGGAALVLFLLKRR
jgi:hypothetical protein